MPTHSILLAESGATKCTWLVRPRDNRPDRPSAPDPDCSQAPLRDSDALALPRQFPTEAPQFPTAIRQHPDNAPHSPAEALRTATAKTCPPQPFEEFRTRGINAMQQSEKRIRELLLTLPPHISTADEVWFYGAGCGERFPATTRMLHRLLGERFPGARIGIESDLTAAARALFGEGEGIACILGTGSNSCHCLRGKVMANTPPLGYILGDEGSGAYLGRDLLNALYKGRIGLREELEEWLGMGYEQIIRRVYREADANRFLASLTPFIARHLDHEAVYDMALDSFALFARRNLGNYPRNLTVGFVGGVAAHFEAPLRRAMQAEGWHTGPILEAPARTLMEYHLQNRS